jgi:plastocyanin
VLSRRTVLAAGAGFLTGIAEIVPIRAASPLAPVEIYMKSDKLGTVVGFDPIGVLVQSGARVRWICDANVHTTTAYSPVNDKHSLRIPKKARPWNSGFLLPGQRFEVTLTIEGVYDYFCAPHEAAGMVGRLIVGEPTGPGALPFDYFKAQGKHWTPVPPAAQKAFPSIAEIMQRKVIPSLLNFAS